jgi:hypothetical protein
VTLQHLRLGFIATVALALILGAQTITPVPRIWDGGAFGRLGHTPCRIESAAVALHLGGIL